tara:strand:- start:376 stop:1275 length:900 start_codon:yes stop_codon:yes gene_type:complete
MEKHNVLAGNFVDRKAPKRKDDTWLDKTFNQEKTLFVPIWNDCFLVNGNPKKLAFLKKQELDHSAKEKYKIFLGFIRDHPIFAIVYDIAQPTLKVLGEFEDLRILGDTIPAYEANLAAHACGLTKWHDSQKYCGNCGSPTKSEKGGNSRRCQNNICNKALFPRVDPAIIVLVTNGKKCLLGRQASWPKDRYSTIAGFVEPGESLEDAVCREVFEETNILVEKINYSSSQPWPFPSSLMVGFTAEVKPAVNQIIKLNDEELDDAAWFSREDLLSGFPKLPSKMSISRRLIDNWINSDESK